MFKSRRWTQLQSAAVIVLSVAALLASFVGLPLLMTYYGAQVDAGLIVNAFAAAGAFSAAAAAVWVAINQRNQYRQDRDETDQKQAGLVRVKAKWVDLGKQSAHVRVTVKNFGRLPIVDVTVTDWEIEHQPITMFSKTATKEAVLPTLTSTGDGELFDIGPMTHEIRIAMQGQPFASGVNLAEPRLMTEPTIHPVTDLAVSVQFTDASEKRWKRSTRGEVTQMR